MPRRCKSSLGQVTRNARSIRLRRQNETEYERFLRLAYARRTAAARRSAETPEMRSARLTAIRESMQRKRKQEKYKIQAALFERHRQWLAAQTELSDEQVEKMRYENFDFGMNYFNQAIIDEGHVIYCKEEINGVVEASDKSIPQENDKLICDVQPEIDLVIKIKEEPLS